MLRAKPSSLFSWCYNILEQDRHLTTVDLTWIREAGLFELDGQRFDIGRKPGWGDFVLSAGGNEICRAKKSSAWFRSFQVIIEDRQFTLQAVSPFQRTFVLRRGNSTVGMIRPRGVMSRKAVVTLPDSLSRAVQVFIIWLVIILWRRQARSSANAATC